MPGVLMNNVSRQHSLIPKTTAARGMDRASSLHLQCYRFLHAHRGGKQKRGSQLNMKLYIEYNPKINYQVGGTTVLHQMVSRYFL